MRKIVFLILALAISLPLAACGEEAGPGDTKEDIMFQVTDTSYGLSAEGAYIQGFLVKYSDSGSIETLEISSGLEGEVDTYSLGAKYDAQGRLEELSNDGVSYFFEWNDDGVVITLNSGHERLENAYDNDGDLVSMAQYYRDELIDMEIYTYENGVCTQIEGEDGHKSVLFYDERGGLIREDHYHAGEDEPYAVTEYTNTYDEQGRLKSVEEDDETVVYTYDKKGTLIKIETKSEDIDSTMEILDTTHGLSEQERLQLKILKDWIGM